jgi:hypothetical protein
MNRPDVGLLIDRKKRMDSLRQNLPMGRKKTIHRATAFPETTPRTEIELHLNGGTTCFNLFHAQKLLGHSTPAVTSAYYASLTDLPELQPTRMGQSKQ